jgi:hypothetical protein
MSMWRFAPIGVLVVGVAWLAVPDLVGQYKAKQAAAESDALAAGIEQKLNRQAEERKAAAVVAEDARIAMMSARKPGPALASLRKSRSEVDGVTWYAPASASADRDVFAAYVGDSGASPWLRVVVKKIAWGSVLLLKDVTILASGVRATAEGKPQADTTAGGHMLERIDFKADRQMVSALIAAADNGVGVIKMSGYNGAEERRLTEEELADLRRVVAAYRELGGK